VGGAEGGVGVGWVGLEGCWTTSSATRVGGWVGGVGGWVGGWVGLGGWGCGVGWMGGVDAVWFGLTGVL